MSVGWFRRDFPPYSEVCACVYVLRSVCFPRKTGRGGPQRASAVTGETEKSKKERLDLEGVWSGPEPLLPVSESPLQAVASEIRS